MTTAALINASPAERAPRGKVTAAVLFQARAADEIVEFGPGPHPCRDRIPAGFDTGAPAGGDDDLFSRGDALQTDAACQHTDLRRSRLSFDEPVGRAHGRHAGRGVDLKM